MRDRCRLFLGPEREEIRLPSALREKKIKPRLQSTHVCRVESNVAAKRRQLIKLLGGRRKQTGTHGNDQTPQRAGASLWMRATDTKGKTFEPSASVLVMKEYLLGVTHQSVDCWQTARCLYLGGKKNKIQKV